MAWQMFPAGGPATDAVAMPPPPQPPPVQVSTRAGVREVTGDIVEHEVINID